MSDAIHWPTHAYVPGKTPRHPEGAFDTLRDTVCAGMFAEQLAASAAFQHGLRYLREGYYWEAHEVFEPVWMVLPDPSQERAFVQGLIQIANGLLKVKMERPKAAARLAEMARALMPDDSVVAVMGVDLRMVHGLLDSLDQMAKDVL